MNNLKLWRENAMLTQEQMSSLLEIPKRTIENWEAESRKPPVYVEKLVIEKLMSIAEHTIVERATKNMNKLKSDENGNRPVGSWAIITTNGSDEFIELYDSMYAAIEDYECGDIVYIACNATEEGLEPWYVDRNNEVYCDYDCIKLL